MNRPFHGLSMPLPVTGYPMANDNYTSLVTTCRDAAQRSIPMRALAPIC